MTPAAEGRWRGDWITELGPVRFRWLARAWPPVWPRLFTVRCGAVHCRIPNVELRVERSRLGRLFARLRPTPTMSWSLGKWWIEAGRGQPGWRQP